MTIHFVKDESLPVVLCGHRHMPLQYRKRTSSSETVCELQFDVLLVKKTTVVLLLYYRKSSLCKVLACVATHTSRQERPSHFAN